jgi:hypothetical protein
MLMFGPKIPTLEFRKGHPGSRLYDLVLERHGWMDG